MLLYPILTYDDQLSNTHHKYVGILYVCSRVSESSKPSALLKTYSPVGFSCTLSLALISKC